MRTGRVLVVGAGLAGLAAAHRLQSAGVAVSVLEARARAGGKYATEALGGSTYDGWPALTPRSSPALLELAAELGVASSVTRAPLASIGWLANEHVRVKTLDLYDFVRGSPLAPLRMRRLALLESWLGGEIDPAAPERATRLDDRSVADFCRVYLGRRALDHLLAPACATLFGLDAANTSRQLLFTLLDGRGRIGLDRVLGTSKLVSALAEGVTELRLGVVVAALEPDGRGVRLAGGERIAADAVVLAVGASEAMRLLPERSPAERCAGEQLHAASALVLTLAVRPGLSLPARVVWVPEREGGELAGMLDEMPSGETDLRVLRLVARPGLFERHGHRPDAELAHLLIESATRVLPGLASFVEAERLQRFPHALPAFAVGHYRALARIRAERCARPEQRVYLAGDWLVAPHLEGELASGLRAAAELFAQSLTIAREN
jgi:oxygen-dependent protoporphyrinogen oxidase